MIVSVPEDTISAFKFFSTSAYNLRGFDDELLYFIKYDYNDEAKSMLSEQLAKVHDNCGRTLLHYASQWSNSVIAQELICLGAKIDARDFDDRTPIFLLIKAKSKAVEHSKDTVNVLLKAKANIDIFHKENKSVLQMALEGLHQDNPFTQIFVSKLKSESDRTETLAERLIAANCNMHRAASFSDVTLLNYMLQYGIDINSKCLEGVTALHKAAELNDSNVTEWLINNGADVNAITSEKVNVLTIFAENGSWTMLRFLLEHDPDPNHKCLYGCTPLLIVFTRQESDASVTSAELLLQHGACRQNSEIIQVLESVLYFWSDRALRLIISHIAILEMLGTTITKPVMYEVNMQFHRKISKLEEYYELCVQKLKIVIFQKHSLLNMLQMDEYKMRKLVRKETFISDVEKICTEQKLSNLCLYYSNTLMKNIAKASRIVKLEDKAIPVICILFEGNYNQCYTFARQVVGYLKVIDLENLVQV